MCWTKTLGVTLDKNLTWENHINIMAKKISFGISALKGVRGLVDQETATKIYQGFIEPFVLLSWDGLGSTLDEKLQRLQNRAAPVMTGSTYDISSSSLLGDLGWNQLSLNRQKQKAILMFKTLYGQTP